MAETILKIKTRIPPLNRRILPRPALLDKMNCSMATEGFFSIPMTLISAPAGYGKTSTLRAWISGREERAAWFSLDKEDSEPDRFWLYLITAIREVEPSAVSAFDGLPGNGSGFSPEEEMAVVLAPLLNELYELEAPLFLVLDDYHLIDSKRIHEAMLFFIENLPPQVHVVLTTRSDPPWPLARWRVRNIMQEIRLGDLVFSMEETAGFLEKCNGIQLKDEELGILHEKTEGWIAGLQLAAISMTSSEDQAGFIQSFDGSHRHVLHFLSEEIFNRHPGEIQEFLLYSSILTRFCPSLCNRVCGREDSAEIIALLERENLFIIPLDDRGEWYRYHPLFADLLLIQLRRTLPGEMKQLHSRAASWFIDSGQPGEAIRHTMAGDDFLLAGALITRYCDDILFTEGPGLLNRCIERLPDDVLIEFPTLLLHKILYCLNYRGKEDAARYLSMTENLDVPQAGKDEPDFEAMLSVVRAFYYVYSYQFADAKSCSDSALQKLSNDNAPWRMRACLYSGDARFFSGDPRASLPFYQDAHGYIKSGDRFLSMTTGFKIATALYVLGRLQESEDMIKDLIDRSRSDGFLRVPRMGLLWGLLGELYREKGDLAEAERLLERALSIGKTEVPSYGWNSLYRIALCRSAGNLQEALVIVRELESLDREVHLPLFVSSGAVLWKARLLAEFGNPKGAKELLSGMDMSSGVSLVLIQAEQSEQTGGGAESVISELEKIIQESDRGGAKRLYLEALLMKASVQKKFGKNDAALTTFLSALKDGRACGFFRIFLDNREQGEHLFSLVQSPGIARDLDPPGLTDYLRKLMETFDDSSGKAAGTVHQVPRVSSGLIEQLSSRELEILTLVGRGFSNHDIGEKLFISSGTVKWHVSNIFGKLGVGKRTRAVAVARDLGLI